MNTTLQTIQNHRSIRSYKTEPVAPEMLDAILAAAQAMPTSVNGQQLSVIVVQDVATKKTLSEIAGGQPWVAQAPVFLVFVADFHKTSVAAQRTGNTQVIHESSEGLVVGTFDAGLAMGAAIIAAESLGLGIVPIGGIRRDPQAVVELLGLPPKTFPVAGLVVGHPADPSALKPRMPKSTFVHSERYQTEAVEKGVESYDATMAQYYQSRGDKATDWSTQIGGLYKSVYYPKVHPVLKNQGFHLDK